MLLTVSLLATLGVAAQDTYTVVGNSVILNGTKSWDLNNNDNNMTLQSDGTYQLVIENCGLEAGTYEYKIVENHSYTNSWPADNDKLVITETAKYTVTFTFDPDWQDVSSEAVKTGSYTPGASTWTIAGSSVALFGTSWDPSNTANDMTLQSDGTYKLELKNKPLGKGTIEYKVTKNHDWGTNYPSSNASFAISEDGEYNVTFTFNETTHALSAEAIKTSDAVITHTWTIAGGPEGVGANLDDALLGKTWDATIAANDMTEIGGNMWTLTKTGFLSSGIYYYKVCADHEWSLRYPKDGNEQFAIGEAGVYRVTFTFNSETTMLMAEVNPIDLAITGVRVYADMGEGQQGMDLPLSGMEMFDQSDEPDSKFRVTGYTVTTSGNVTKVTGHFKLTTENGESVIPENGYYIFEAVKKDERTWEPEEMDINLVGEDIQDNAIYIFEFYFEATDGTNTFSYNNGGANYKIKYKKGKGDLEFYESNTASLGLTVNGKKKNFSVNGDSSISGENSNLGQVGSLIIDDIMVRFERNASLNFESQNVSLQFWVEDQKGSDLTGYLGSLTCQEQTDEGGDKHLKKFYATNMGVDLFDRVSTILHEGQTYRLCSYFQLIDNNGKYYMFPREKRENAIRLTFTYDTSTGITTPSSLISHPSSIYDLQGRKIIDNGQWTMDNFNAPANSQLKPGIYIRNGKKIVLK